MKMKTKQKISHIAALIGFGMITIIWAIFMFWWVYPYKTTVNEQPYKLADTTIKRGELLQYEIDYCKYTDVTPTVHRQFIDGIIYSMPETTAQLKKGCGKFLNSVAVPENLPPGEYYLKVVVSFKMNPIRIITKTFVTEKFNIIK